MADEEKGLIELEEEQVQKGTRGGMGWHTTSLCRSAGVQLGGPH
jgi:hypothetical protein